MRLWRLPTVGHQQAQHRLCFAPSTTSLEICRHLARFHYGDVIMGTMASQFTSLTIVYSAVYSGVDQRKHQSSASLAFVRGIHRWPVNSPHKWPVTRKMFPFHNVIMWHHTEAWSRQLIFVHTVLSRCQFAVCVISIGAFFHSQREPIFPFQIVSEASYDVMEIGTYKNKK